MTLSRAQSTASQARRIANVAAQIAVCGVLLVGIAGLAWGQDDAREAADKKAEAAEALAEILVSEGKPGFVDPLGRDTPRSSMRSFLLAAEQGDFQRAQQFMDFRNLPREMRGIDQAELAEWLYLVISRTLWIDEAALSDSSFGAKGDGLPDYRDLITTLDLEGEPVALLLQRVPADEPGHFIWKISNASVAQVPGLYEHFGYPEWVENFRQRIPSGYSFLGVELFKWIIMVALAVVLWPLLWLFFLGVTRLLCKPSDGLYPEVRKLLTKPLPILIVLIVGAMMLVELGLGATAQGILKSHTLTTFIAIWLLFCVVDLIRGIRRERFLVQGRDDAAVLGRPMANAVKLIIALLGVLLWLSNMGVNISALLAGLGVGGIAMALALQKPIEDLFGAITLYSQRPISTGDVCRYGNHFGKVEEIGLRSTRIRTLGNTIVSVPNSRLALEDIENISARKSVWYQPLIRLRIDTSPEQMRAIVEKVRQCLIDDEQVLNDVLRVQFRQFGEYSLDIKVHCYVNTTNFDEYLEISEQLNFRILEIVEESGASLALPLRGGQFAPAS